MKKMFTLICLAVVALMGMTTAQAQERKLTADEAVVVVKEVVPAVFDQVKELSGIDFLAPTRSDFGIESLLDSRLFNLNGMALRAADVKEPLRIQPDSMRIDIAAMGIEGIPEMIKPLLSDVRLRFDNWATLTFGMEDRDVEILIPGTIYVDLMPGTPEPIMAAVKLEFKTEVTTGFLPFQQLTAELTLEPFIKSMLQMAGLDFAGGKLITFTETPVSQTQFDYNLVFEPALRGLLELMDTGIVPDLKVTLDLSAMEQMQVKASMYGILQEEETTLHMCDALLQLGEESNSVLLTTYYKGEVEKERLLTVSYAFPELLQTEALMITDSARVAGEEAWDWKGTHFVTMSVPGSLKSFNYSANDLMQKILMDVTNSIYDENYEVTYYQLIKVYEDEEAWENDTPTEIVVPVLQLLGNVELEYTYINEVSRPQFKINVVAQQISDAEVYPPAWDVITYLETTIPTDGPLLMKVKLPKDGQFVDVAKLYAASNAMGVITDTDAIDARQHVVTVQQDGIVIEGVDQAVYSIIDLSGKMVTKGRINNSGSYIPTSHLAKGFYILHLDVNGKGEAVKFLK